MRRHFYICNNLDELELVEKELENHGISTPHIHVLSLDDGEVARHSRLHEVEAVLRTDVVHG
ncbi:NAD/FAD-utilizing enzyme, partial [Porticoccaceae bacterium]|nr:NAD/FAD-utilizing enzyme [Porticoccaceae bacterium]